MRSSSASLSESFLHHLYPETALPPLWEVIYQEAIRGHHLLFKRIDVERYDNSLDDSSDQTSWLDSALTDELELIALKIIGASDLQGMIRVIDALADGQRRDLYRFYRRILWMWQHYVKTRLN